MSATYESTDDYTVCISDRGMSLYRAENDNELMRNLRRTPMLHAVTLIVSGVGIVGLCVYMFVEACVRNS
jgi:hypothetical protein